MALYQNKEWLENQYINLNKEVVHHEDENPSNNNIENLRLFETQSEHVAYHNRGGL